MSKIKFLAISDPHWYDWANPFNSVDRLKTTRATMAKIYQLAREQEATILLPGDLAHGPEFMSNRVLQELIEFYQEYEDVWTAAIDGNHDQSEQNTLSNRSPNWVTTLAKVIPNFYNVADYSIRSNGANIHGISYLTGNKGFKEELKEVIGAVDNNQKKKHILLIHTDLPRAKDASGYEVGEVNGIPANMGKLFKKIDLVLAGHIHMGQVLTKKVIMVGTQYQQRKSDANLQPGYWEIYDDLTYKFKKLNVAPVYKTGERTNDTDFFTKKPKTKKKVNNSTDLKFDKSRSNKQLVNNYLEAIDESSDKKKKLLKTFLK